MKQHSLQVDRTKPSTACAPCRKSRSKCDRKRPQCSQCVRKSRVCSGYRQELDLVLRNENDKTQVRVSTRTRVVPATASHTASGRNVSIPPSADRGLVSSSNFRNPSQQLTAIFKMPVEPDSVVATNFFYASFDQGLFLDYLPDLCARSSRSLALEASFEAVSLSYLAKCRQSSSLDEQALRKYSQALRYTMQALQTPSQAVQDDTLASVMLLALYGAFAFSPEKAKETWTKHSDGAVALLSMRAKDSFRSARSQLLLDHAISSIQMNCIQRRTAFHPQLWSIYELSHLSGNVIHVSFWKVVEGMAALRESVTQPNVDLLAHVYQASEFDRVAAVMLTHLPGRPEDLKSHLGTPRASQDSRGLQARNTLMTIRIELNKIILSCAEPCLATDGTLDETIRARLDHEISSATLKLNWLATEICDSIPDFLCPNPAVEFQRRNHSLWICSFVLPLFTALGSKVLSADLDVRIRRQLKHFSSISENATISRVTSQAAKIDAELSQIWFVLILDMQRLDS